MQQTATEAAAENEALSREVSELKDRLADADADVLDLQDELEEEKSKMADLKRTIEEQQQALDQQQEQLMSEDRECPICAETEAGGAGERASLPFPEGGQDNAWQATERTRLEGEQTALIAKSREIEEMERDVARRVEEAEIKERELQEREGELIVRLEAVVEKEKDMVQQEEQLRSWDEMLQHKEATLAKDEVIISAQKQHLEQQRQEMDQHRQALDAVADARLQLHSETDDRGSMTPRLPPPDTSPDALHASANGHLQSPEEKEGVAGSSLDHAGSGGHRGKDKQARRTQILRIIGERDGLLVAKQQLTEDNENLLKKCHSLQANLDVLQREVERLAAEGSLKPYHASLPFECVTLLASTIAELRLLAHAAQSRAEAAGRLKTVQSAGLAAAAVPRGELLSDIRALQDLSVKLYPPPIFDEPGDASLESQEGELKTIRAESVAEGEEESTRFWDLAVRLLQNSMNILSKSRNQDGGDPWCMEKGGDVYGEELLVAQDRILQLHATADLKNQVQREALQRLLGNVRASQAIYFCLYDSLACVLQHASASFCVSYRLDPEGLSWGLE